MEKKWKNHSSIYPSKTSKAYKYCLYPVLILLICLIIFLFVGQIEVIVRGNARVIGEEIIIQGINDETIIENHLIESKEVKKGDSLVKYDTKNYKTEIEKLEKQNDSIQVKLDSLDKVKQKIIIKYEKAIPSILDASAADDVIWLDTKLKDLRKE